MGGCILINKDEIAKKVLSGEISDSSSLNAVLRVMIKDVVETAMKTEPNSFLGYDKNRFFKYPEEVRKLIYIPPTP